MALLNPADTQYFFDVVDGWGGNLDTGGAISDSIRPADVHLYNAAGGTDPLKRGSIVAQKYTTEPVVQYPLTDAEVNLDVDKVAPNRFWMVVEGNTQFDYSARAFNKVVCLRGNFAVETAHVKGTLSIGDKVTVEHGASAPDSTLPSAGGVNEGRLVTAAAGDPVLGRVVDSRVEEGVTVYTVEMDL